MRNAGRYDPGLRRRGVRRGRERGCWVYIPADELEKTRIGAEGSTPYYRTHGRAGGRTVLVELFREP